MRARNHGLAELPSPGQDPQIAHIFRNMRAAMRLPREAIARRLATTVSVIENLENGAVGPLPHWPETVRIVRSYCELLGLDAQPLLWRIQQILRGAGTRVGDDLPTRSPGSPPLALRKPPREPSLPRRGSGIGGLLLLAMPPVAMAALTCLAMLAPAPTYKIIARLPHSLAVPARAGMDLVVLYSAPRKDGLRQIDIGDPKLRKVDKQRTRAPRAR